MIKKLPHDQISKDIVTKWQWGSLLCKNIGASCSKKNLKIVKKVLGKNNSL